MDTNNSSFGWFIGVIIFLAIGTVIGLNSIQNNKTDNTQSTKLTTNSTIDTIPKKEQQTIPQPITWHCTDVTSYNKNPYDDNLCVSSTGERRYVSDSQARALDSSYTPGTSGHPYYNSK